MTIRFWVHMASESPTEGPISNHLDGRKPSQDGPSDQEGQVWRAGEASGGRERPASSKAWRLQTLCPLLGTLSVAVPFGCWCGMGHSLPVPAQGMSPCLAPVHPLWSITPSLLFPPSNPLHRPVPSSQPSQGGARVALEVLPLSLGRAGICTK